MADDSVAAPYHSGGKHHSFSVAAEGFGYHLRLFFCLVSDDPRNH
jgi:hypothetical protein